MASTVSDTGSGPGFEPVPQGTHLAICTAVVNMGLQDSQWGAKNKHYIGFSVPGVTVEWTDKDGQDHSGPALIGMSYTSSLNEKAILRKHLESWRGRAFTDKELAGFDLFKLLGVPCLISVTHNHKGDKVYANISAIMGAPAGTDVPQIDMEHLRYDPNDPESTPLENLPQWMQKKIGEAVRPNGQGSTVSGPAPMSENPAPDGAAFNDSIPFARKEDI